jgi:hypothetical protein
MSAFSASNSSDATPKYPQICTPRYPKPEPPNLMFCLGLGVENRVTMRDLDATPKTPTFATVGGRDCGDLQVFCLPQTPNPLRGEVLRASFPPRGTPAGRARLSVQAVPSGSPLPTPGDATGPWGYA